MNSEQWKPWIEIVESTRDNKYGVRKYVEEAPKEVRELVGVALSCAKWHPDRKIVHHPNSFCGLCYTSCMDHGACFDCRYFKEYDVYCFSEEDFKRYNTWYIREASLKLQPMESRNNMFKKLYAIYTYLYKRHFDQEK